MTEIRDPNKVNSIYIHVPFCKRKCHYCDFVSYAGKEALIDEYVEAVCEELKSSPLSLPSANSFPSPSKMERGAANGMSGGVRTVFFGGGTPTLLEAKHFEILKNVGTTFMVVRSEETNRTGTSPVPTSPEISAEANPGTADRAKLSALRELGINRLSIGVQSFNDEHLNRLGRIHDAAAARRCYTDARAAGFDNINLDLIFALPGQTLAEWQTDLKAAIDLAPEHLSCYSLQIEEGTPFYALRVTRNEETELAMYEHTIETLSAAGYKHYEISNFAQPGFECRHNINYWQNGNYLGFGAGAHSHWNGRRWANPDLIEEYLRDASRVTPDDSPDATDRRETIFLGLRLLDGVAKEHFQGFEKEVADLRKEGLLTESNGNYQLTRRGLYLGNEVFARFV